MINAREQWLDFILNSLPDHVFILDENGYYIDSYGGQYNSENFDAKSYIGLSLDQVLSPAKAAELQACIDQVIEHRETLVVRYSLKLQDHLLLSLEALQQSEIPEESWFEAIINYIAPSNDDAHKVMWSVRNVTQTHLLEKNLKSCRKPMS